MKKGHKVTMKEIAKKLGVSVSTVSRALKDSPELHEETKRKIVEMAKEMNYQPNLLAQSLESVVPKPWASSYLRSPPTFLHPALAVFKTTLTQENTM